MDISLDQDQQMLLETAVSFAAGAMTPARIRELEETDDGFDMPVWKQIADMGWAGALFPEQYGGAEASPVEMALVIEALGQGAIPSPLFSTVIEAGLLLLDAGSEAQRGNWLPRISTGDAILTTAIMEATGGLKPAEIRARITPSGNGFTISGTKLFVRDARAADAIILAGRTGDGPTDLMLLMVPRGAPGLRLRRMRAAGGESLWEAVFANDAVDGDAAVGDPASAWSHISRLQHLAAPAARRGLQIGRAGRHRTGIARPHRILRQDARTVRRPDRPFPRRASPLRGGLPRYSGQPAARMAGRGVLGRRTRRQPRGVDGQGEVQRGDARGDAHRASDSRRHRLLPRLSAGALLPPRHRGAGRLRRRRASPPRAIRPAQGRHQCVSRKRPA
jgi:hypothetical protein